MFSQPPHFFPVLFYPHGDMSVCAGFVSHSFGVRAKGSGSS